MGRKLEDELEEHGCSMRTADFREMLEEQQVVFSPQWKIDELLCHPDEAKQSCRKLRELNDTLGMKRAKVGTSSF